MVSFLSLCSEGCQCDNFPDCNAVVSTVYYCATVMMSSTQACHTKQGTGDEQSQMMPLSVLRSNSIICFLFSKTSVVHWCPNKGYSIAFQMLVIG